VVDALATASLCSCSYHGGTCSYHYLGSSTQESRRAGPTVKCLFVGEGKEKEKKKACTVLVAFCHISFRTFKFYLLCMCVCVCVWGAFLCNLGCPGACFVDQDGLELRDPPASASQVLGFKVCVTTPGTLDFTKNS